MATEDDVPSAQAVADAFVKQYFHILGHLPQEARRLYVDTSVVSRPGPDGTMMSFNSIEAINEQILSCDYENTAFDVLSVDSQNSFEDGIFIMVIGFLTGKDNRKRKYSQMFYLARQNNAYVVVNDIFRYVDEEASTPVELPVLESVPANEAKPADELKKTELNHKIDAFVEKSVTAAVVKNDSEVTKAVVGATTPLDNEKMKHSEKAVTAQKLTESVAETVSPELDGAKRSFAAIVQSMARNAAPFQIKAPVHKPKSMEQHRASATPQAPGPVRNYEKKNDQKIMEEPGTSIFVANLPLNAMPPQLHELYKDFGPIKANGIQIRTSRYQGNIVCFGFVAFESPTSVQSVLQAAKNTPFMLADRKLRVKEKDVEYEGNKNSGKPKGGNRTQNGSAEGGDEFRRNRNRRNGGRNERRGDRNANGDHCQKNNEEEPRKFKQIDTLLSKLQYKNRYNLELLTT